MDSSGSPLAEELREDFLSLVGDRRDGALQTLLVDIHPADIAALIAELRDDGDRHYLFGLIEDPEVASQVLAELPDPLQEDIAVLLPHEELSDLVEEMASDDAADLIQQLPEETAARVLQDIEPTELAAMRPLLAYPEDTAGGLMATEVLTVDVGARVGDARDVVRARRDEENVHVVYVVDAGGALRGSLSMRDMVIHRSDAPVTLAMDPAPPRLLPDLDQERVAELFRKYDLVSAPVVDERGVLLGRITVDDVVDVIREEAEEDLAHMAGTREGEFDEPSARRVAILRLPWILTSLMGGLIAGGVLRHFTSVLPGISLFLVAFVPVITAMGGNAGSQAAITMVRRLALTRIGWRQVTGIVLREARIGILLGVTSGVVVGLVAYLWRGDWFYGAVVGVAMTVAILVAATMGAVVPLVLHRLRIDPAIATGPFVSMSNDVTGLFIYFGLATLLLEVGLAPAP